MKQIINILLFVVVFAFGVQAQQLPKYTLYTFDKVAVNPAFAGVTNIINASLSYRNQYMGLDGAPITQRFIVNLPIQKKYMGLGLRASNDAIGFTQTTSAHLLYSYHLGLGNGKLSFGLEGGIINYSINLSNAIKADAVDAALDYNANSALVPDFTFGALYFTESLYVGAAAYQLIENRYTVLQSNTGLNLQQKRHFIGYAGYFIELSEKKTGIEPSVLVKYAPNAPMQFDAGIHFVFRDLLSIGANYRTQESIAALVKLKLFDKVVIGYSYDYGLNQLATYNTGSHEILLALRHKLLAPSRDKLVHPRFYF